MTHISLTHWDAALQPHYPKLGKPQSAKRPAKFFSKLPTELWLMIDEDLDPIDRRTLRMSSKVCMSMLNALPTLDLTKDKIRLTCLMEQDWLKLPSYQICIICAEPHERLMAQPRAFERQFENTHSNHRTCKGGLRLTADRILCQCCWTWLILNHEQRGVTNGKSFWDLEDGWDSWKHVWRTEWRKGKLLLELTTELCLGKQGGMAEWLTKYGKPLQMMQLMVRLPFCGCKSTHGILEQETLRRIRTYLAVRHSNWRKQWETSKRSYLDCVWCGALYTVAWANDRFVVTRYYNLSSPEMMAASIHWEMWRSLWRVPQSWKDVGMRNWLEWRVSCMKEKFQRLCGVSKAM